MNISLLTEINAMTGLSTERKLDIIAQIHTILSETNDEIDLDFVVNELVKMVEDMPELETYNARDKAIRELTDLYQREYIL